MHVCPSSSTFGSHLCTGTSACLSFASWRYWCVHVCPFSLTFGKVISVQVQCMFDFCKSAVLVCAHLPMQFDFWKSSL